MPWLDVVRDVGDVHAEPEAGGRLLDLHRVVEVLRRFAVDRHDALAAEVAPTEEVLHPNRGRELLGLVDDRLGKAGRQVVGAQHDLDVDSGLAQEPEPLLDDAVGDPAVVGEGGQPNLDDLPVAGRRPSFRRRCG